MELMTTVEREAYAVALQSPERHRLWHDVIAMAEQGLLKAALETTKGNQTEAAAMLGINRSTFRERMTRYDLSGCGK